MDNVYQNISVAFKVHPNQEKFKSYCIGFMLYKAS